MPYLLSFYSYCKRAELSWRNKLLKDDIDGYAGNINPTEAWEILKADSKSILLDVRTLAEWTFVGVTDLSSLKKDAVKIEWKTFPNMEINPFFIDEVINACPEKSVPILSLCRSGQRSIDASRVLTEHGFQKCYNVLEGFEGDTNTNSQRISKEGWKHRNLPWKQN